MPRPIAIVGPGRLGRTVAAGLARQGWAVTLVARGQPIPPAPLTWLTVPDQAIAAVAASLQPPPGGVVLHASGATDLAPLRPHPVVGSLHPLMTFPDPAHGLPPPTEVPAAVAGDPAACVAAEALARALGWQPFRVPGDRALYHAAAVIAGNYATTLLGVAAEVLAAAGVPAAQAPRLLMPLARASLENAARLGPRAALTGPVARGDEAVIARHRAALKVLGNEENAPIDEMYDVLLAATRRLLEEEG